jgi:hypothetical protein
MIADKGWHERDEEREENHAADEEQFVGPDPSRQGDTGCARDQLRNRESRAGAVPRESIGRLTSGDKAAELIHRIIESR